MRHSGIAIKIWLSVGVFVAGALASLGVGQLEAVLSEARLRTTSDALFPAAQHGQQAEAAFQRMAQGFQDAVVLEEAAALDRAERDGQQAAAALTAAADLSGLTAERAGALHELAGSVSAFARDAKAGYAPMLNVGDAVTPQMALTAKNLAGQSDTLTKAVSQTRAQLAADLQDELMQSVRGSVRQRRVSLFVFALALVAAGIVVTITIRRSIVAPIQRAVKHLTETSVKVVTTSTQLTGSSQSLSQGASEQAASLEETSASMEEMASMTRQNAEHTHNAARLMNEVDSQVKASNGALTDMVASMSSIQDSSRQVAKIIKTIDEIAFQTNILALNAAVEAARAGQAGLGFAVVADEVRNLAQRSAQAARDTAAMIEASIARAQAGNEKVEQVASSISGITTSVEKVKRLVDEVSAASRQQTQGLDQVSQAIAQMEKVTQTTAATAEESAAVSEELSAQAGDTMGIVRELERLVGGRIRAAAEPLRRPSPLELQQAVV